MSAVMSAGMSAVSVAISLMIAAGWLKGHDLILADSMLKSLFDECEHYLKHKPIYPLWFRFKPWVLTKFAKERLDK